MATVGDIFRTTVTFPNIQGPASGKAVFHYQVIVQSGSLSAEHVNDELIAEIVTPLVGAAFTDNWSCNKLDTVNLMDLEDFNVTNPQLSGTRTGTALPGFMAWTTRSPYIMSGVHRARHRFPGAAVSDLTDTGAFTTTFRDDVAPIVATLGEQLVLGGGTITPCVVRRTSAQGVIPATYELRGVAAGTWEFNMAVTTQNSRKLPGNWIDPNA
jgi:hypothetical protein